MIQVNAMGDACPIPVVKTLQALKELHGAGTVQTLVDNKVAVENLTRLAESKGCTIETAQLGEKEYRVTITPPPRTTRWWRCPPTTWARAMRCWVRSC